MQPNRPLSRPELARFVEGTSRSATDFTARCFRNSMWRHHYDVIRWRFQKITSGRDNLLRDLSLGLAIGLMRFCDDSEPFNACCLISGGKNRHTAFAYAINVADDFLDLLRIDVTASLDDYVLHTSGYEKAATSDVTKVASIQPIAIK